MMETLKEPCDVETENAAPPGIPGKTRVTFVTVLKHSQDRRAVLAAVPALTLGNLGGGVLPVAWAFSVTGIICGVLIMVVVSVANTYTCDLLLKQAYATRTRDYESLALAIGGPWWKLVTEISIVVLLLGSLVGQISQIGEVGIIGLTSMWSNVPHWVVQSNGRVIMVVGVLFIVAPLCLITNSSARELSFRTIRCCIGFLKGEQTLLEYVGVVGTAIVLWLLVCVVYKSCSENLPAITKKEFPVAGFSRLEDITQAVSIFGFAFYIQPIMMPLLEEVPAGKVGVKIVSYSTRIVVLINSFFIYFFVGFFGAAYYGNSTAQNILENKWLGGGVPQGILNVSMTVYLCVSSPTLEFPTRQIVHGWLPKNRLKNAFLRQMTITTLILGFSLAMALAFPSTSGNVLAITGATGGCMVSCGIPVVSHFLLMSHRSSIAKQSTVPTLGADMEGNKTKDIPELITYIAPWRSGAAPFIVNFVKHVAIPGLVIAVGFFCSVATLTAL